MRCFQILLLTTLLLNAAHGYTAHYNPNKRSFGDEVDVNSAYPMRLTRDVQRQDYFSSPPDEQEMVLKGVEDGGPAPATGWGISVGAMTGLLGKDTVAGLVQSGKGFLPENVQAFVPSEEVIKNYLPDVEPMAVQTANSANPVSPVQSATQMLLGGTGLSPELSGKLVSAVSDQILNKKNGNLNDIMTGMGQAMGQVVAQKAVENAAPLIIRLVVHKVLYGLAEKTVGTGLASMARNRIAQVADAIADRAIAQFTKYDGPYKVDLINYLTKMNYADGVKNIFGGQQKKNA